MTCLEVEQVLPDLLDEPQNGTFQSAVEIHLRSCPDCADLVSDMKFISGEARNLTDTEEPSPRVWLRIAAELRAEGLIRDAEASADRSDSRDKRRKGQWGAWWLVPITAVLLVAGSYVWTRRPVPEVSKQAAPVPVLTVAPATQQPATQPENTQPENARQSGVTQPAMKRALPDVKTASSIPARTGADRSDLSQSASESAQNLEAPGSDEDREFLSAVSTRAPSMKVTYENQLQAVNANIREVQAYLQRNPGDADARQQLMDAYQQKALLYQIALDRIQ